MRLWEDFSELLEKIWAKQKLTLEEQSKIQDSVALLRGYAIFQEDFPHSDIAKAFIKDLAKRYPTKVYAKGNLPYEAFKILVLLEIFSEDQNLLLEKFDFPSSFTKEEEEEAVAIASEHLMTDGRRDLRKLFTFTIDGEQTMDFDDALSVCKEGGMWAIYIHIADVAHYIEKNSLLDLSARERRKTLYLIDQILPMFPQTLSFDTFPLREGRDSLAITTKVLVDEHYAVQSFEIFESLLHVDKNYSYAEMDEFLEKKPNQKLLFLPELLKICQALQKYRVDHNGGIDVLLPHVAPYLQKNRIYLKVYNPGKASPFIIRELMIWNNFLCACYMDNEAFPFLYLSQESPSQEYKIPNRYITKKSEFSQLNGIFHRSYLSVQNVGHFALGVDYYTQITSPIRRYIDVVLQRQLKNALNQKDMPYSIEEIEEEAEFYERGKFLSHQMEGERQKYYLLKFLAQTKKEEKISGTIMKILSSTECLVEIHETQITCKAKYTRSISPYTDVHVKLHSIYPRLGLAFGNVI